VAALKNFCPQLLPIEKLNMKLTTKSQLDDVSRNYSPIAKNCSLFQCPAAILPNRVLQACAIF
jgi:hypothetical protein